MNPLVSLSHMLWNTYVGTSEEVSRYVGECMAVFKYTLLALENGNLGKSMEVFLIDIFKRLTLEDIVTYFKGVKLDSDTLGLIYQSGNMTLLQGMLSDADEWLVEDRLNIAITLTSLGCQNHNADFLRYLRTRDSFYSGSSVIEYTSPTT